MSLTARETRSVLDCGGGAERSCRFGEAATSGPRRPEWWQATPSMTLARLGCGGGMLTLGVCRARLTSNLPGTQRVRSEVADRRGGGGSRTPSSPECLERAVMSAGSHRAGHGGSGAALRSSLPEGEGRGEGERSGQTLGAANRGRPFPLTLTLSLRERGKPPDVVGGSDARPARSAPGNSPSASLRRCPPLRIAPSEGRLARACSQEGGLSSPPRARCGHRVTPASSPCGTRAAGRPRPRASRSLRASPGPNAASCPRGRRRCQDGSPP